MSQDQNRSQKRPSFASVKAASLKAIDRVLAHWLPNGKREDGGKEYSAPNPTRADKHAGSFKVNLSKGTWSDFATGDKGGDLIDLVRYLDGGTDVEACNKLADFLGVTAGASSNEKSPPSKTAAWVPILPIPDSAMRKIPAKHRQHGAPSRVWIYRDASSQPLMALYRFDLGLDDSGTARKVFAPLTWCKDAGGSSQWRWQGLNAPRPLLRLDELAKRSADPVVLCEGEKAADAAGKLLPGYVSTCWLNGTNSWQKADFLPLAGRDVLLWPDNDSPGLHCMVEIEKHLLKIGAGSIRSVPVTALSDQLSEGDDAADFESAGWTSERLEALIAGLSPAKKEASPAKQKPDSSHPTGFRVTADGVSYASEDGEARPVCSRLEILARTRDEKGHNWGLLVEFDDPDGDRKRWNIPARSMAGDFGKEVLGPLVDMGLRLAGNRAARNSRNDLQSYLQGYDSKDRARLVTRLGWQGNAYLLPDQQVGASPERLHFYDAGAQLPPISRSGSLDQWQRHIGALCVDNHRLTFAVCVAFAGPLLQLLGQESGGFHLYGDSSGGKTTHLQVAASVYGGQRLVRSWRSTDNALESIAAAHSDGLLVLDEIGMCDPRIIGETVYMLGNGAGKARANDRGLVGRQVQEWRLLFLSTGEKTLAQHMSEAHKELKAGMEVRLLAVPADAGKGMGMFEALHGFSDAAALSDALKARAGKYYGAPLLEFLNKLCAPGQIEGYRVLLRRTVERFVTESLPPNPSGQAQRAAGRFGLAAAAGELATALGVTGWPDGTATKAAEVCLGAWLGERGGAGNMEGDAIISRLRGVIERYGESRFTRWDAIAAKTDDHAPRTADRLGFRRTIEHGLGDETYTSVTYYFLATTWRDDVFKGMNVVSVNKELIKRGVLEPAGDGKASQSISLPGMPKTRAYIVNASALLDLDSARQSIAA